LTRGVGEALLPARSGVYVSPAHQRRWEHYRLWQRIRVPPALDPDVRPLKPRSPGDHSPSCRWLGLGMAVVWGRRHVATLSRSLEAQHHRTHFHQFGRGARWASAAVLRLTTDARLVARCPRQGDTRDRVRADSQLPANSFRPPRCSSTASTSEAPPPACAQKAGHVLAWHGVLSRSMMVICRLGSASYP